MFTMISAFDNGASSQSNSLSVTSASLTNIDLELSKMFTKIDNVMTLARVDDECKNDRQGSQYRGKISHTRDGDVCLSWMQYTNLNIDYFPDESLDDNFNHCRNPDNDMFGPWCLYLDKDGQIKASYCDIPYCPNVTINRRECKTTIKGVDYAGTQSQTIYGEKCQTWSSQHPHAHMLNYNNNFPENNVKEVSNYCRNPNNYDKGPWCHTTNPERRSDYCMIPMCSEPADGTYPECKSDRRGTNYRGKMNLTISGKNCISWTINEYTDADFPDKSKHEALNYCRNPDNDKLGPWCLTEHNYTFFGADYCGISICNISNEKNDIYNANKLPSAIKTALWDAAETLIVVLFPLLMILGLTSNSLCIAVFTRPELNDNTTAFLLIILAIMDTFSLMMDAFPVWLRNISGLYLDAYNDVSCKVYHYLTTVVTSSPGWTILVVTFERYIAIAKPHRVKSMCTKKKTGITLMVILFCLFLLNIPTPIDMVSHTEIIFDQDEVHFEVSKECAVVNIDFVWVDTTVRCLIPFAAMLLSDLCIVYSLYKFNQRRQEIVSDESAKKDEEELRNMTLMLLLASFTYLLLTLPYMIYILFPQYTGKFYESYDEYISAMKLWYVCSQCCIFLNNSVNFLLYCISGETFREEFLVMCGCRKRLTAREKVIEQARKEREERLKEREMGMKLEQNTSNLQLNIESHTELCEETAFD